MAKPSAPATCYNRYFCGALPQYLAVFLQRSRYHLDSTRFIAHVDARHFDLSESLTLWEAASEGLQQRKYDLYATIAIRGRDMAGHYLDYVKHGSTWFSLVSMRRARELRCLRADCGGSAVGTTRTGPAGGATRTGAAGGARELCLRVEPREPGLRVKHANSACGRSHANRACGWSTRTLPAGGTTRTLPAGGTTRTGPAGLARERHLRARERNARMPPCAFKND